MKARTLLYFLSFTFLFSGCSGCSQSGRRKVMQTVNKNQNPAEPKTQNDGRNVIKMEKQDGVYMIPVEVNGVKMYFIFDTGASTISISETEALFLYKQGTLKDNDIKGTARFSDANGDISEGTIIVLKTVQIGNKVLKNVDASVVHNLSAPLLFGQSALERFGKISIDYNKGEIAFE
jgi:aspartyl protease family protein